MAKSKKHVMGRWGKFKFFVSPRVIRSFEDLQIKATHTIKTTTKKDKNNNNQEIAQKKVTKATEISINVHLNRYVGNNVRKVAMDFVKAARKGKTGKFFVGGKKLFRYKLRLISATASNIELAPNGTWIRADLALTFKQSTEDKGSGSESSKVSTKKTDTKTASSSGGSSSGGSSGSSGSSGSGSSSGGSSSSSGNFGYPSWYTGNTSRDTTKQEVSNANSSIRQNTINSARSNSAEQKSSTVAAASVRKYDYKAVQANRT